MVWICLSYAFFYGIEIYSIVPLPSLTAWRAARTLVERVRWRTLRGICSARMAVAAQTDMVAEAFVAALNATPNADTRDKDARGAREWLLAGWRGKQ